MMIDWVTGCVSTPPQLWPGYDAGCHLVLDEHGEVVRKSSRKFNVQDDSGSWSRNFTVWTPTPGELWVSGNPVKLLQGHNAFGSCDALGLFFTAGAFVRTHAGLFPGRQTFRMFDGPRFTRLDLTRSYRFPSQAHALAWLREVAASARDRRGGSLLKGDTVYFGKNSTRWTMKLYEKRAELQKHARKRGHSVPASILEWASGVVRFELTMRSPELQKAPDDVAALGGPSSALAALRLWERYYDRITWNRNMAMADDLDLLEQTLPGHLQLKLAAWRSGADMRRLMTKPTFYRVRRELLDAAGVDIASPPVEPEAGTPVSALDPAGWDPEPLAAHYREPDDARKQYGLQL